ncbi:hypothetical protein V5O48_015578 [Marasmius crinis-equi]|uniref:F-box domain-containing protein n=1 Tax=Marasmius crinis-equi TaxID=585013 RepID=A0ABR3EU50_9AGAR
MTLYACKSCGYVVGGDENKHHRETSDITKSLSRTNNPPSAIELGLLREEYKDLARVSASLEAQIVRLRTSVAALEKEQGQINALLLKHRSVLNPCRRLPGEILADIFDLCVREDLNMMERMRKLSQHHDSSSTLDIDKCPWVLGQVCRGWRDLVLSLPRLWSSIDINWPQGSEKLNMSLVERRLTLALQRSRDKELHVSWHESSCPAKIVPLLCLSSFRWVNATIRASAEGFGLLAPYSGLFSSLSTLHLHFKDDRLLDEDGNDSVFRDTPTLRHLTLSGHVSPISRLRTNLPWSQLLKFTLRSANPLTERVCVGLHKVLPLLRGLRTLEIQTSFEFVREGIHTIALTHLRTLTLASPVAPRSVANLLDSVTLPSLRVLAIAGPDMLHINLQSLLTRSSAQLDELSIAMVNDQTLTKILEIPQVQTVQALSIGGPPGDVGYFGVSDNVLNALKLNIPEITNAAVLPCLQHITLLGRRRWTDKALVEMLASRRNVSQRNAAFNPIVSVALNHAKFGLEGVDIQMKNLLDGGLTARDSRGRFVL